MSITFGNNHNQLGARLRLVDVSGSVVSGFDDQISVDAYRAHHDDGLLVASLTDAGDGHGAEQGRTRPQRWQSFELSEIEQCRVINNHRPEPPLASQPVERMHGRTSAPMLRNHCDGSGERFGTTKLAVDKLLQFAVGLANAYFELGNIVEIPRDPSNLEPRVLGNQTAMVVDRTTTASLNHVGERQLVIGQRRRLRRWCNLNRQEFCTRHLPHTKTVTKRARPSSDVACCGRLDKHLDGTFDAIGPEERGSDGTARVAVGSQEKRSSCLRSGRDDAPGTPRGIVKFNLRLGQ